MTRLDSFTSETSNAPHKRQRTTSPHAAAHFYASPPDTAPTTPCAEDYPEEEYRFGHGPNAWIFSTATNRFDLSRASRSRLLMDVDETVHNHCGIIVDPARTILVIVDMQNYFIHPDCTAHATGLAAVSPLLSVMDRCRAEGVQIAFLNWVVDEQDLKVMPPGVQRTFCHRRAQTHGCGWHVSLGSELPGDKGRVLWRDSWNADLYEPLKLAKRPEDVVFHKNRPSGMWNHEQDMHQYLLNHGKKTVMFAGVNTDQCVLGTLTDTYSNGFDCILLRDCTATQSAFQANELCNRNVADIYGFVIDSSAVLAAVREERWEIESCS